jgi:hypothetical protein
MVLNLRVNERMASVKRVTNEVQKNGSASPWVLCSLQDYKLASLPRSTTTDALGSS